MKEYNKRNISLAKELRKNMTPWERKLWYQYLSKYPVRFQRQKAIGNYIVDFYCAKARLVVELDGGGHYENDQTKADALRTQALEGMNLRVLRICNLDLDKNFRGVCECIDNAVQNSLPQSAALTAPSSEGAYPRPTIYALGFFDGVHLGHQALLAQCRRLAQEQDALAAAITFDQHPQALFTATPPLLINHHNDRMALMTQFGIQKVCTFPVAEEVMSTNWVDFLEKLLKDGAVGFVCGDDFRFGHKGAGNHRRLVEFCKERNLPCVIVPEQTLEGIRISSSHIRSLIEAGQMEEAAKFLGHLHSLSGSVVPGRQLGRTIGVPTANVLIPDEVVVPRLGVYASECLVDGVLYKAVTNIGSRPTVGGHQTRAESWLLDFDGDLYGKHMTVLLHKFLRPEQKFADLEELKWQIRADATAAREALR